MDNSFVFNEATLKRMPHFFVLIIFLLLGLPYIGLSLGVDFSVLATKLGQENHINSPLLEAQIKGYFTQTLLQWSGFSLAAVTVLLAFTQYKLSKDKTALIIGLSVLFSVSVEALNSVIIDGLALDFVAKNNLDALIWVCSNCISGLILIAGLTMLIRGTEEQSTNSTRFFLVSAFLVLALLTALYHIASVVKIPEMWYKNSFISRPYELLPTAIYLILIFVIYPKAYKKNPTILTDCIFYMGITQVVISIYLMMLSHAPHDSAYNIAYFLKVVAYFIPCTCLIINFLLSYYAVLNSQKNLKEKQDELKYIASHDSLTNLFNRREFEDLLDKSISNSLRNKTSLALLLIDIDNFKATNDTFGHIHGDELLKQFSNRLEVLIRKGDILARVGGDEFTLISPNIKSPSSARQLAERILNELNSPYLIDGKLITVTVSIGISIFPDDGRNSEKLLIKADLAMYKAKSSGKNTYQFYTAQLSYMQHRESEVEAHLRKALQHHEFELNYQPIYNLKNREIIGAEILLRWHNSVLGDLSPNEFIPVAERSGLIIDLGYWILRKACEQIRNWKDQYNTTLSFSVNISPIQLVHNNFLDNLENILHEFNSPEKNLELEITENILMEEGFEITNVLNSIAAMGIKISLDDFGKGYSSLNRIKTLPIDTLKIDKVFISDISNQKDKIIIVDIIIKLANELGMGIIAEGIETVEQLEYLISKKCYYGQGFLLSNPLTADEFTQLAFAKKKR